MQSKGRPLIGTLQGRLTPSKGRGIQFFPDDPGEWEREFEIANQADISAIQWVWDKLENPLLELAFRLHLKEVLARTGISVRHVDMQMFTKVDIANISSDFCEQVCEAIADIDGKCVELPLLEGSTMLEEQNRQARLTGVRRFVSAAQKHGVRIAIEADPPPALYQEILETVPVGVVYDSGNSAGMGYDVTEELSAYGDRVINVHIKDRSKGGPTVALGTGAARFPDLFAMLSQIRYSGPITLQAARGEDGHEIETVKRQVAFVHEHMAVTK